MALSYDNTIIHAVRIYINMPDDEIKSEICATALLDPGAV